MKAFTSFGGLTTLALANGARMPSTADDDCADRRSAALRLAENLRCGFDRDSVMRKMLRQNPANLLASPEFVTNTAPEPIQKCVSRWCARKCMVERDKNPFLPCLQAADSLRPSAGRGG